MNSPKRGALGLVIALVGVGACLGLTPAAVGAQSAPTTAPPTSTTSITIITTTTTTSITVTTAAPTAATTDPTTPPTDTTPPTIGVTVTHPHFSPDGDGVRDKVFIELRAVEPVTVSLVFRNPSGTARKTEQHAFGSGALSAAWGGRIKKNGAWRIAADGNYQVRTTASDGAANATQKTRPLTVDTTPPSFAWSSVTPDPWGPPGRCRTTPPGVAATFFSPGDQVVAHPAQAQTRATATAGHSIGSHSNGHAQLNQLSYADIVGRLRTDQEAWWGTARATPSPYFRPPYGSYDSTVLQAAGHAGFRYTIIWDVDPNDWTSPGSSVITSRVLGSVRPGSIVLLHVKSQTAVALPAILNGLRARGLQPSSIAQLFHAAGWP